MNIHQTHHKLISFIVSIMLTSALLATAPGGTINASAGPQTVLSDGKLQKLIELNIQLGSNEALRPDIVSFLRLTADQAKNARQYTHPLKNGASITFVRWDNNKDEYVFWATVRGKMLIYHTNRKLEVVGAMQTSATDSNTVPVELKEYRGLDSIMKGWSNVVDQTPSAR